MVCYRFLALRRDTYQYIFNAEHYGSEMEENHYHIEIPSSVEHDESSDSVVDSFEDSSARIPVNKLVASDTQLVVECLQRMNQDLAIFALSFSSERSLSQTRADRVAELEAKVSTLSLENARLSSSVEEANHAVARHQQDLRASEEVRTGQVEQMTGLLLALAERAVLGKRQAEEISRLKATVANQERDLRSAKENLDRMAREKAEQDRGAREAQAREMRDRLSSPEARMPRRSDTDPNLRPLARRMDSDARRREMTEQFADGMSNTVGKIASWWMASASASAKK
jgi:hypothetical protein